MLWVDPPPLFRPMHNIVADPGRARGLFSLSDFGFCTSRSGVKDERSPRFSVAAHGGVGKPAPPLAAAGGRLSRSLTPRGNGAVSFRQKAKGA